MQKCKIPEPDLILSEESVWLSLGIPLTILAGSFLLFATISSLLKGWGDSSILIMPSLILMGYFYGKYNDARDKQYLVDEANYYTKLNYNNEKKNKEDELWNKYYKELNVYNKKIEDYNTLGLEGYKRKLLLKHYQEATYKPKLINTNVKKGKTEQPFYELLREHFGECISNKIGIKSDGEARTYVPDMVYYNSKSNICIDIEIDEKYTANGKMIHYLNCTHDSYRDEFFDAHSWIVLRFAEKQVIEDASGCVKFLHNLLLKYDPNYNQSLKTLTLAKYSSVVNNLKKWSKPKVEIDNDDIYELPF